LKKYKILITIDALTVGGAQKVIQRLIPEWISQGHTVKLVLLQSNKLEISTLSLEKLGLSIYRADARNMFDLISFVKLSLIVIKYKPDFIHAHLYWSQIWSALIKIFTPVTSIIWIEHNTYLSRTRAQWFVFKWLSILTKRILAVSYEVRDFLKNKISVPVVTVLNPISNEFKPEVKNLEFPSFLFVGRLVEQKNPILALEAFSFALNNDLIPQSSTLTVVGEGPLISLVEYYVSNSGFEESFRIMGHLNENQLAPIFAKAVTLISTSFHEGSPLVRLEALASGCTVVTTKTGGVKGILTKNEYDLNPIDGVFFVENDKQQIAKILSNCLGLKLWTEESVNQRVARVQSHRPEKVAKDYLVNFNNTDLVDE
jgi:glycosyltransferase involved in cell wall biosynthesis